MSDGMGQAFRSSTKLLFHPLRRVLLKSVLHDSTGICLGEIQHFRDFTTVKKVCNKGCITLLFSPNIYFLVWKNWLVIILSFIVLSCCCWQAYLAPDNLHHPNRTELYGRTTERICCKSCSVIVTKEVQTYARILPCAGTVTALLCVLGVPSQTEHVYMSAGLWNDA